MYPSLFTCCWITNCARLIFLFRSYVVVAKLVTEYVVWILRLIWSVLDRARTLLDLHRVNLWIYLSNLRATSPRYSVWSDKCQTTVSISQCDLNDNRPLRSESGWRELSYVPEENFDLGNLSHYTTSHCLLRSSWWCARSCCWALEIWWPISDGRVSCIWGSLLLDWA
jgi:hypothetical protein